MKFLVFRIPVVKISILSIFLTLEWVTYLLGQCLSVEQVPWESIRIMRCEIQIEKAHLRGISYSLKGMFKLIIIFFAGVVHEI